MSATTAIEWTDATVNFWEGCTKVGPGCDFCYAAERDRRFHGGVHWGPGAPRRWVKGGVPLIVKLQRSAADFEALHGRRRRAFINSLSDFLDNEVGDDWRLAAGAAIDLAPSLDIQIVTKRIGNLEKLAPAHWLKNWPRHVGLMITVVNQQEANRDIPKLLEAKGRFNIPWVGLSCEPLLEQVKIQNWLPTLDWVITGGESGSEARPSHPRWFRSLRDQCAAADVPFFLKQWGEYRPATADETPDRWVDFHTKNPMPGCIVIDQLGVKRVGKKHAGALLDGRLHREFPTFGRAA